MDGQAAKTTLSQLPGNAECQSFPSVCATPLVLARPTRLHLTDLFDSCRRLPVCGCWMCGCCACRMRVLVSLVPVNVADNCPWCNRSASRVSSRRSSSCLAGQTQCMWRVPQGCQQISSSTVLKATSLCWESAMACS